MGADPGESVGHAPRAILSGLGWNTASQAVSVLVYLGLTPFLLHRLGLAAYGVYALVSSFRGLVSNLDGGLGPCATRYFAVHAGSQDRRAASALLVTMSAMTIVVVGVVAGCVALIAPQISVVLHTSVGLRHEAADLIRVFMPLLVFSSVRLMLTKVIMAEHRWAYVNGSMTAGLLVYAALAVVLVQEGHGLISLFWASVGQELVMLVTSAFAARRYLVAGALRFVHRETLRELVRYSVRVQIAEVASSFNFEIDALIVGLLFPVSDVALYTIGLNFSTQLVSLPLNAVPPIAVALSRTFGRDGLGRTLREFVRLQHVWVRSIAAFALIGAASALAAIPRWLGTQERLAGVVAAVLLLGQAIQLLSEVMDALGKSVNRPGLESRYLSVGMVVNLALTIPLATSIGMLGVPIGTAVGEMVSTFYFLKIARRDIARSLRSFLADVPVVAVAVSVLVTAALEIAAYRLAPVGPAGLIICAIPAALGLGVYTALVLPPTAWRRLGRLAPRARRSGALERGTVAQELLELKRRNETIAASDVVGRADRP